MKDKSIGLIKWQKAGLENLLVSPDLKRRIRSRAIRDYQIGEYQNSPYPFNVAPQKCAFLDNPGSQRLLVEMYIIKRAGETNKKGGKEPPTLKSASLRFLILKFNR